MIKSTKPQRLAVAPAFAKDKKPRAPFKSNEGKVQENSSRVLVKTEGKWYDGIAGSEADALVREIEAGEGAQLTRDELSSLIAKAEKLLNNDVGAYKAVSMRGDKRGDFLWMEKIMKTGTLSDRMAAFAVKIQDSPVHNLNCLQQLIGMVKTHGKQQCLTSADTARDLFLEDLLPPNRKLIPFEQRGTLLRSAGNKQLVMWLFEDKLKGHYRDFIEALRRMSSDTIDKIRGKGISVIYQLLEAHPEQEHILLPLIVNKLGDPVKKVASGALFHLNKLLEKHPQMKVIVVDEVERLLFRNNIGKRAQYYGICFLNSIRVLGDESSVASKLVKVYLAFFKACIKTGEIDSKMMSGLLNGVNKAFSVARVVGYEFGESVDTLYNIIQLSHFNIGVQALGLLFQITEGDKNVNQGRFYRVLYRHLMSPEVATTSHAMQFLNIVFKSMKRDTVTNRVIGFSKRLLQLCNHLPPNLACAILFLISEVSKSHKGIIITGASISSDENSAENSYEDPEEEERQKRNKKKYLASVEKLTKTTNIKFDIQAVEPTTLEVPASSTCDDEEKNTEAKDEESEEVKEIKEEKYKVLSDYDPMARNPAYCGAELTLAYELTILTQHFHPSVALFSQSLLDRRYITYDGNPLKDFTVGRFLERFVYRNAKQRKHPEYQPQGLRNVPVNSNEYLDTEENKIPIEEKFFYKFFKDGKAEKKKSRTKKNDDEDVPSDVESVDDDEFDEFMDNYFKSNKETGSDGEDGELDFAAEVKTKKKGKRKAQEEEEEEEDASEEDDDDEEAIDFDGDDDADELIDLDEGNDEMAEMDLEDGSDDDDFEEFGGKAFKEKLQLKTKKFKGSKGTAMFANADDFSEMLEANADVAFSGSNTLINKDNSHVKQLKWETQRDRWVKGYKNKSKDKFSKKRKFKK